MFYTGRLLYALKTPDGSLVELNNQPVLVKRKSDFATILGPCENYEDHTVIPVHITTPVDLNGSPPVW